MTILILLFLLLMLTVTKDTYTTLKGEPMTYLDIARNLYYIAKRSRRMRIILLRNQQKKATAVTVTQAKSR